MARSLVLAVAMLLVGLFGVTSPARAAAQMLSGFGGPDGFGALAESRNDDGSSAEIPLGAGFPNGLNFFGNTYQSLYINNNGNVTFRGPVATYTPMSFPISTQPMIAPWWADVDTRSAAPGDLKNNVYYTQVGNQFIVTWDYVGYYAAHADKLNAFQLILTDRSDVNPGDFDVEFRYEQLQWTTGDASGGSGGLGGVPAQMGFDAGDRTNFYKHPDSLTAAILNLTTTSNVGTPGVWRFQVRHGAVSPPTDILTNVNVVARLPAGIDVDTTSFVVAPQSTQVVAGKTVITWHYDTFSAEDAKSLDFDVIVHNPVPGEQRQVSYDLELSYLDVNGNPVTTALGPQYLTVLPSLFTVSVATDQPAYDANQSVQISGQIGNLSQFPATTVAHVLIVDGTQAVVADLGMTPALSLAAGQSVPLTGFTFATGSTLAGSYSVRVDLLDASQHLAGQASAPFQIRSPTTLVTASVSPDKQTYQAWDTVVLSSRLTNTSPNAIQPPMTAQLTVSAPGGGVISSTSYSVNALVPGAHIDLSTVVHLSDAASGQYSVQLAATDAATAASVAGANATFQVTRNDLQALTGSVRVQSPTVYQGVTQLCTNTASDISTAALNAVTLTRSLVNLNTQAVIQSTTQVLNFNSQQQQVFLDSIATAALPVGPYGCVLSATYNGSTRQLGSAGFQVLPPPIQIDATLSPGTQGRLLVLMDDRDEGPCGRILDVELWGAFHTPLPRDATVDVELRDDAGNLVDHESVALASYRGTVNRSAGKGVDMLITGVSSDVLTVELRSSQAIPTGLHVTAKAMGASIPPIVLDTGPMGSSAGWPITSGARFGDFSTSNLHALNSRWTPDPRQGPTVAAQRAFLQTLLKASGWSYTIVTEEEDFERELNTGAYNLYALLAQHERPDQHTRQALREAVFRGEGLLVATGKEDGYDDLAEALGVEPVGETPRANGIEVFDPALGVTGTAPFALTEEAVRAKLAGAQAIGRFDAVVSPFNVAVSTYQYGHGKSVYIGYRALAEATAAGSASLHATLLENALGYITPSFSGLYAQEVVPLHLVLTNKGIATPGQIQLTLPAGVTVVDPGTAQVSRALLTWSFNLAKAQQLTFDAWVRLPSAAGPVAFDALVQTGTSGNYADYKHLHLTLNTIALATLADAQALAATDHAFMETRVWLDMAQWWLDRGHPDLAVLALLQATEELARCTQPQAAALRLDVDQVIWTLSRTEPGSELSRARAELSNK
jgi:hypothetical protein